MIQHAKISEIPDILDITDSCRRHMDSQGIYQWTDEYPSKKQFEIDMERKELYTLKEGDKLIGCIVLSTLMDKEYEEVEWLTPNNNNIYVHRLAINPSYQGNGYAQQLMAYAEAYARTNDYSSVRLDTFSQNKRNQRFYEQRGYQKLKDIYFPQQSDHPFHCYELVF
ncbi:GNAT family N-acetyltransferase [Maribacter aestuarii]|uniref:GNAT family N-acetyltransferase n=1 Tax=Maribacter aestuarii TaxID=1130723 RepID=UPI00248BF633|nr:GNAT family N-acetyltransferase [Maribacter aestuarii]